MHYFVIIFKVWHPFLTFENRTVQIHQVSSFLKFFCCGQCNNFLPNNCQHRVNISTYEQKTVKWLKTGQIKAWMTILTWYLIKKFIALSKKIVDYVSGRQKLICSMWTMSYFLTFAQIWHLLVLVIKMCIEVVGNKSYW